MEPIEPPENAAEPEPEPEPSEEPEDDVPEIFQGQLYPPLPDLEPDPAAGDIEPQEEALQAHVRAYNTVEKALATNDFNEESVAPLIGGDFEGSFRDAIEGQRDAGTVSLSPDGEIAWVDVIAADSDEVVIGKCLAIGPLTGSFDAETGEPQFDDDPDFQAELVRTYTYRSSDDGWVVVDFSAAFQEGCSEL